MKATVLSVVVALAVASPLALAQTQPGHAHVAPATNAPVQDVPAEASAAVAVAERFGAALAAGDLATVESLLDPDVLILESGGAERSREEYLGHHAKSDAQFLKGTHSQLTRRRARVEGDLVWIGSESELHASRDGKPLTLLSTETMLLRNTADGWKIVHIHWSSRPKKGA
ncbi:MAG TPA: nuclear transport factor 2 family protein [Lysobacter sp.]|nr:nuclear transport factor 2 family protein [Lysobacter sp.]